ncbi:hypothetical protein Rcae01_06575 [Novipirellula caenicola]|uniref:Uncharacterized protein n=1 Tax=Novipirellula caenicola TaxID=1536901 RepID=A0ABP9W107_9BACT
MPQHLACARFDGELMSHKPPRPSAAGERSDEPYRLRSGEGRGVHTRGGVRCGLFGQPSPEQSPEALLDLSQTLFGRGDTR